MLQMLHLCWILDVYKRQRYNFTVEENMPFDKDVSLDPELLGKVFENLLASYNPETQQTARKQMCIRDSLSTEQERNNYLLSIGSRIKWDKERLNKIIHTLSLIHI